MLIERSHKESKRLSYVECGVGEGHTLYSVWAYLNEANPSLIRGPGAPHYLLMDTFQGVDPSILPKEEAEKGHVTQAYGGATLDVIKQRFAFLNDLSIIAGTIPSTLVEIPEQCQSPDFLHIDMNNSVPEIEALKFFYPKMKRGSIIVLDDYSFANATEQHQGINELFASWELSAPLTLPTGQGLVIV